MSATFFAVLKIAGIVLLVLLLVFLIVCVTVLLWPVSFYLEADIPETVLTEGAADKIREEARINAGFTWLFRLIHTRFSYPFDENFSVRVLWWRWQQKSGEEPQTQDTFDFESFEQEASGPEPAAAGAKPEVPEATARPVTQTPAEPEQKPAEQEQEPAEKPAPRRQAFKTEPEEPYREPTLLRFFSAIFRVASFVLTKPYEVFWKIRYTISSACDKIDEVRAFLDSELFARAKDAVILKSGKLLRGIRPKRIDVRLLYGTGDPALTAELLAVYGMLYPLFGAHSTVQADFDRSVLGLHARIKGRVTFFRLLNTLGALYYNKDIRKAIRRAERILHG